MVIRGWPSEAEIRSTVKTCVALRSIGGNRFDQRGSFDLAFQWEIPELIGGLQLGHSMTFINLLIKMGLNHVKPC